MTKDLEKEAKAFQSQREEIAAFVEGASGDDMAQFIAKVSGAVKQVRQVVATAFSGGNFTITPDNKTIQEILNEARKHYTQDYHDGHYIQPHAREHYESIRKKLQPLIDDSGKLYLKLETGLDKLPDILKKLAEDKDALTSDELSGLKSLVSTLQESKKLLTATVEMHNEKPHEYIGHKVAESAHAALQVLNRNLLPRLTPVVEGAVVEDDANTIVDEPAPLHLKMLAFESNYAQRHGNDLYVQMINDLEGKKPPGPRRIKGGHVAAALAGALAGGGVVEGYHRVFNAPTIDAAHTRSYDPNAEKAAYLKKIEEEKAQKDAGIEKANQR